jgi:putative zinc finger/helix-turn-helix YgiT family protein
MKPKQELTRPAQAGKAAEKPFPRRCPECGKAEVRPATIAYDAEVKHDGRLYRFHIARLPVNKCGTCGEVLFGAATDDRLSRGLREHLALLSPEQIRDGLTALGLQQKEFAEQIGVAAETISRWLSGTHIQSRAMDNLMRLFFAFDNVRLTLGESGLHGSLGVLHPAK